MEAIEPVQKIATKMLAATKGLEYEERLRLLKSRLKLPTLRYRRRRGDLMEMYEMITGIYDEEVLPHFDQRDSIVASSRNNRGHNKHYRCLSTA